MLYLKRSFIFLLFPMTAVIILIVHMLPGLQHQQHPRYQGHNRLSCIIPDPQLYPPKLQSYFNKKHNIRCVPNQDWVYLSNGSIYFTETALGYKNLSCEYMNVQRRSDDEKYDLGDRMMFKHGDRYTADVFIVECTAAKNRKYKNVHLGVVRMRVSTRSSTKNDDNKINYFTKMNILIFLVDSVSRMEWIRKLPLTYDYLINMLNSTVLEGYDIVGDGTREALLPILTGKTVDELPESRRFFSLIGKHLDHFPFIWKNYKNQGYVTMYAEDRPDINTFNGKMIGFKNPPTDHYARPFYLAKYKIGMKHLHCHGSLKSHHLMLNYIRGIYKVYPDRLKFTFVLNNQLAHSGDHRLGSADTDIRDWMIGMSRDGYLNNTVVVMMSDHGSRFDEAREFVQGRLEEMNPFVSVSLPAMFREKYPKAAFNLRVNARRLTTPFDIYATFYDLLQYQGWDQEGNDRGGRDRDSGLRQGVEKRGISLLQKVPEYRTCKMAQIPSHFCACQELKPLASQDPKILKIAKFIVDKFNSLTSQFTRESCENLTLSRIDSAEMFTVRDKIRKFKRIIVDTIETYRIKLHTNPGGGAFEVTISCGIKCEFNEKYVSRINTYGRDTNLLTKKQRSTAIAKYCNCRK